MDRRAFIAGLAAAVTTVSYFDMGTAWRKNEAGVYLQGGHPIWDLDTHDIMTVEKLLKEHYKDRTVASLTYDSRDLFRVVPKSLDRNPYAR